MMKPVHVPFLGANDTECIIIEWIVENDDKVFAGDRVCAVETTKAAIDVESDCEGFIYPLISEEERVSVGDIIAVVSSEKITDKNIINDFVNELQNAVIEEKPNITKKAEILINRNNLKLDDIVKMHGSRKITEKDIISYLAFSKEDSYRRGFCDFEKVGIVGGVRGGGALIIVDALLKSNTQRPVCIFDRDSTFHGSNILGVPVSGSIDLLDDYIEGGIVDSVVVAFNSNLPEREDVYNQLHKNNIPICNVIDPRADIRSKVTIGSGNVILGNVYIGSCSQIGNNNFISANVCLEHGNILGNHSAFGPGVFTSGNVTIGDRVRFGTGVFVEPNLSIGNDSIISSGAIITYSIAEKKVVRVKYNQEDKDIE